MQPIPVADRMRRPCDQCLERRVRILELLPAAAVGLILAPSVLRRWRSAAVHLEVEVVRVVVAAVTAPTTTTATTITTLIVAATMPANNKRIE